MGYNGADELAITLMEATDSMTQALRNWVYFDRLKWLFQGFVFCCVFSLYLSRYLLFRRPQNMR